MRDNSSQAPLYSFSHAPSEMLVPRASFSGLSEVPFSFMSSGDDQIHRPFDVVYDDDGSITIEKGFVICGNTERSVESISIPANYSGSVFIKYSVSSKTSDVGKFTLVRGDSVITDEDESDGYTSKRLLYSFSGGDVTWDYRCTPVFVLYN